MKQASQELVSELNDVSDVRFDSWCIKRQNTFCMHFNSPFLCNLHCFENHVLLEGNNTQREVGCLGTYYMGIPMTCLKLFKEQGIGKCLPFVP